MMTKEEKLQSVEGMFKLLDEAEYYETALSHASYIKGMIAILMADGSIEPDEWTELYKRTESIMATKYNLKSVTGVPF